MKRTIIGFRIVLLIAYVLVPLLDLLTLNMGFLKVRGFCWFCDLTNLNLEEMDLYGTDLYYATLNRVNLTKANLTGTNLSETIFCKTTIPEGTVNNSGC